ncbi:RNA polymerase sigma factor [Parapedobacter indicus]|uniref:DNA-directed RNA polymerase specialized sigma subunit, sigma24 family n=1 Tax=Parapedobacter indicus TaxID=1477437 RepID=A0A1I3UWS0_9SPHI|nr:sigma-70 family RNA polymerase sigma factor [Parapedobacter indicus]PPK99090.1 DNA-directed RNA polymerase specialized sigma24 family protein [Parapedobacter indicus]SFJ86301.1 DNA-directed RNA polymerase specialized sigma subunit, sigma24 family [Parapedobacter indicus]
MEKTIMAIYQHVFPSVARYVSKRGGTFEEAKDVFHEALLVYYEKMYEGRLNLQQNEEAYIFGIVRHLWTKRYVENQRFASLDQLMAGFDSEDSAGNWEDGDSLTDTLSDKRILRLLQAAGRKCMEVLTAFYYEKLDMQELAHRFGFSGTRSATVQKFKCLQKVKQVVKEKSLQYEDFVG